MSNGFVGRRYYVFALVITFFVFLHHRYKKVLLFAFCLVFLFWMDIDFVKLFIKPNADNYEEIVLRNVNPKHEIKFFIRTKEYKQKLETFRQKYNIDLLKNSDVPSDYFSEIMDFYNKFKLNGQYTITMPAVNIAPFVIDGKYPTPALLWQDGETEKVLIEQEAEGSDIVIISKGKFAGGSEYIVKKNYVLSRAEQFKKVYETSLLIFYANKNWLKIPTQNR
jgi:hypothetical protein